MIQKAFNFTLDDLYFQELPGCNFNPNQQNNWPEIVNNCMEHVYDTIENESIQCVIIIGAAAQLYFNNTAEENMNDIFFIDCNNRKIPAIVSRSPESVLALESKRAKYEDNKSSADYITAKEEEIHVKKSILSQLELIRKYTNC